MPPRIRPSVVTGLREPTSILQPGQSRSLRVQLPSLTVCTGWLCVSPHAFQPQLRAPGVEPRKPLRLSSTRAALCVTCNTTAQPLSWVCCQSICCRLTHSISAPPHNGLTNPPQGRGARVSGRPYSRLARISPGPWPARRTLAPGSGAGALSASEFGLFKKYPSYSSRWLAVHLPAWVYMLTYTLILFKGGGRQRYALPQPQPNSLLSTNSLPLLALLTHSLSACTRPTKQSSIVFAVPRLVSHAAATRH